MKNKNYHIILLSLIFAILLWFLINMNQHFTTTENVRINLINSDTLPLKKTIPSYIKTKIQAKGWDLISLKISGIPNLTIDLLQLEKSTTFDKKAILNSIALSNHYNVVDVSPDFFKLEMDAYSSRKVPIQLDATLKFKDAFGAIGNIILQPESVLISGAKSIVDTIRVWKTQKIEIKDISSNIEKKVPLMEPPKHVLSADVQEVKINLLVEPFAEKTLSGITIEIVDIPNNKEIIVIPPKVDMIIRGSIKQLSSTSIENIKAYISYTELINDTTGFLEPQFLIPEGLKLIKKNPEKFQYIIRKRLM